MARFSGLVAILAVAVVAAYALAGGSRAPAAAPSATAMQLAPDAGTITPAVQQLLEEIKGADTDLLAVSEEDGRLLRVMVASSGARQALEIGGANGYSAIWIGLGLRQTGGHLTTIEYDPARARTAADNVRRAGLSDIVTVVPGDAFNEIPKLQGEFDFVFLDAWKRDYKRFLDMVFPRLVPGGLFLAHNVVNKQSEMTDFLQTIETDPRMFTSIVTPSGEGVSITMKRREQVAR
jgi:predicted O-methyltransferase YrrM